MPVHGKIVVIKRSGGDGTEFPLAASCLFGRKTDCDIRIQLPQVSKEHCRIDLNENKEVIVTNLSSANPTCINGEALQQSERLKHGDVITIIDRSFRFEYPPAPTPKKRSSIGGKAETLKVLQDHQVGSTTTVEKRISEASSDPHLKVGTNHDNIQRSLEKTLELESKEDGSLSQSQVASPFNDLYQMIKKSLDVKTPRKSSASLLQTPSSKFCTPLPQSVRKNDGTPFVFTGCKSTPKREAGRISPRTTESKKAETPSNATPQSVKMQRRSLQASTTKTEAPDAEAKQSKPTSPQTRRQATPQKFTEAIEQLSTPTPKSPVRRRSNGTTPTKETVNKEEKAMTSPKTEAKRKATPRSSEKGDQVKEMPRKRKSGELGKDLPMQQMKKKRVSFGGHLSPELFDKRLPPDSPLRKGAAPRRSLCLFKPKESLLRRASVIGLMEFDQDCGKNASPKKPASGKKSPASKTASPKTPSPGKKSPASKTASPKTPTSAKKSPASKTASPKTPTSAKKSPASPKTPSPGKKSPASKTPSPGKKSPASKTPSPGKKSPASKTASPKTPTSAKKSPASPKASSPGNKSKTPKANDQPKNQRKSTSSTVKRKSCPDIKEETATVTPVKTPLNSRVQTPTVQGRFSVSRISTPSPIAEDDVIDVAPSSTVTPKIPLRRKSMKSTTKKTPGLTKSAVKVIRRSAISRVSMKAMNSWADIVKFGQAKVQRAAPTAKRQTVTKKTVKKVPKPQTPARRLRDHALASTGHANSPATIVVGRAVKQRVVHATGAAPRVVINTALSKKDMKMDEDMTGISEMFKTPVHERVRSVNSESSVLKTPLADLSRSMVEPSMLKTPEEPGQMTVSPLTVKVTRYNSEAVQRLLNGDEEAIFVGDIPPLEMNSDSSEKQPSDGSTHAPTTPKQKIELPECFTGIKRIMKTPKQESGPVEDLRGKLLKTPKQKLEPKECLTGVKRIMKTPKLKAEPVDDIRGNLLKTPKQKAEQQECLTGVKRMMRTPRQKSEPLEDIRDNLSDETAKKTESSPSVLLSDIKTMMKTPREKSTPIEDMVGFKRLVKTPKEKSEPVEKNFGIKRLMKSPRLRGVAPVEDFEGLEELMKEPLSTPAGQEKTVEIEEPMLLDCDSPIEKELDLAEDSQDDADMAKDPTEAIGDNKSEEVHVETGLSDAMDTVSESAVDDASPKDEAEVEADTNEVMPSGTEENTTDSMEIITQAPTAESLALETATCKVTENEEAVIIPDVQKKPARGRRAKVVESKAADNKQQVAPSEDPGVPAPVRGRRGKKTEAPAPPAVRQTTRGRNANITESKDDGLTQEESAPVSPVKPTRGDTKKETVEQAETVQEVPVETEEAPEDTQTSQVHVDHEANDDAEPQEKPVVKQGKKSEPASVPQTDVAEDVSEVVPAEGEENAMDATETEAPEVKTETFKVTENEEAVVIPDAQKKPVRGRRAKAVESKVTDVVQEVASEDPVIPAPVRGRRGKKTEAPAPPAVRQTTRGRNAKTTESKDDGVTQEESAPVSAVKPKRGDAKKETVEQAETVQEVPVETEEVPEDSQPSQVHANHEANDDAEPQEKPVRGRKAKVVESKVTNVEQEVASEDPVVPAPVRGRRGKKTEAPAPPAVRQTTRGRNAKAQEGPSDEKPEKAPETSVETPMVTDLSAEDAGDQPSVIAPPEEKSTSKPKRGRKTKPTPVEAPQPEPENTEVVNDQHVIEDVQPELPVPTVDKHRRGGRKTKPDAGKQNEVTEDAVVPEETKRVSRPPARAKRGRHAQQEEKPEDNEPTLPVETPKSLEPAKKMRRTRKAEQDPEEPSEEVPTAETVTPEEMVASIPAQPEKINEATQVPKPRRGARKAQEPESVTPVESTEVQEVPVVSSTDKPKRGRRGKQAAEEASVPEAKPEHEPETEEKTNAESTHAVKAKPSRVRGVRTSAKDEVSESVPAKRARRGAAVPVEESSVEVTDVVPEPAPLPVEPVKRGRRAATKAKTNTEETVSSDQVNSTGESSTAAEDKTSKRAVRWKTDCEVFEVTPLKTVRGRKLKSGDQKDTDSNSASKSATKTEEEDLSDQKSRPVKRARRGAKVTDVTEESTNKLPEEDQVTSKTDDAEAQPKTRRGRSAKK